MDSLATAWNYTVDAMTNPSAHATGADLYAGVDFNKLNVLEQLWTQWYIYWGNPVIATGVMSLLWHEIVYFGRGLPFAILDAIPAMRKYKIQDDKEPSVKQYAKVTLTVLVNHFTVQLPQVWFFHPICEYFGMHTHQVPFPSLLKIAAQIAFFFVFEDTWHYWGHRGLHWGPLYKYIHKQHHENAAPFGLAAEYAHPFEIFFLGTGTIGAPLLLCALTGDLHIITVYIWIALRLFQAIDAHSGYDFPFSMHNWAPFWSGADHHDWHHQTFVGNYAASFRWWDSWMGTDTAFVRARKQQKEQKRLMAEKGITLKEAKELIRAKEALAKQQKAQ